MIFRWFAPASRELSISPLYGAIVAQARKPTFYDAYGVADTVTGRLEMIMLHAVLVLRRLDSETPGWRELGQHLFDHFCQDMDDNMREMGVGDLTVPRKMRRIGGAFYDRQAAYGAALAGTDDGALAAALRRNIFLGSSDAPGVARLTAYIRRVSAHLAEQDRFVQGEISFPDPEQVILHDREEAHGNSAGTTA